MKFKSMLSVLFVSSMLLYSTACGDSCPDDLSDEMYNCVESAIRAADAYMDNHVSYEVTFQKIAGMYDRAEKIKEENESAVNTSILISMNGLKFELLSEHSGYGTYADLLEERNTLAKKIGYSERD